MKTKRKPSKPGAWSLEMYIAGTVMRARVHRGWHQQELAKRTGMKQSAIARIENGHLPTLKTLSRIAKAVGGAIVWPKIIFPE